MNLRAFLPAILLLSPTIACRAALRATPRAEVVALVDPSTPRASVARQSDAREAELPGSQRWSIGLRTGVALAEGEPSNDIPTPFAFLVRRRLNDAWSVAATLELSKGDYERPYEFVGEQSPTEIDGDAEWTTIGLWAERDFSSPESRNEWYALGGVGFAQVDVEDPPPGPLVGGGTFDLETDVDSEIVPALGLGYRRWLGTSWALEVVARYDYHLTDWTVRDVNTGATGEVDDYHAYAFFLGLNYGF